MEQPPILEPDQWNLVGSWQDIGLNDSEIWQGEAANHVFFNLFGFQKRHLNLFVGGWNQHLYRHRNSDLSVYIDELMLHPSRAQSLLARLHRIDAEASQFPSAVTTKTVREWSRSELAAEYIKLRVLRQNLAAYNQFGIMFADALVDRVQKIISRADYGGRQIEALNAILAAQPETSLERERRALLNACLSCLTQHASVIAAKSLGLEALRCAVAQDCRVQIEELVSEHGWLPIFLHSPEWNFGHYTGAITEICRSHTPESVAKMLSTASEQRKERTAEAERLLEPLCLKPDEALIVKITQACIYAKNEAEYLQGQITRLLRPIVRRIDALLGIDEYTRQFLFDDELVTLLKADESSKALSDASEILARREKISGYISDGTNGCVEVDQQSAEQLMTGTQCKAKKSKIGPAEKLKGICASVGIASGTARLIRSAADFCHFGKNEILVAQMTTVDYVPLMRRASAIITEFGGATCHAAVIARELNVPCVVGVIGILDALHDGQSVCVNATKGEVLLT